MTVQFLDPRGVSAAPTEEYDLRIDLDADDVTVGLLANGFPDSEEFLDAVEAVMAEHLPKASFRRFNKHGASNPVSPQMLGEITETCTTVVAAYGH